MPASTLSAWGRLARALPSGLYLAGTTALAVHLGHREGSDLRFLYHEDSVDLDLLAAALARSGEFVLTHTGPGVLRGSFAETDVEFADADEPAPQTLLEMPTLIAGLRVAGMQDLAAITLHDIGRRRQLGDYFDAMSIEQSGGIQLESSVALFLERFRIPLSSDTLVRLVNTLGYLDDVPEEDLPIGKQTLAAWWARRQARLVRVLAHTE